MSAERDPLGPLARRNHPRLATLLLAGAVLVGAGGLLWVTEGPLGHGLGRTGLRLATLGGIVFAFAVSGVIAFVVFEQGFD